MAPRASRKPGLDRSDLRPGNVVRRKLNKRVRVGIVVETPRNYSAWPAMFWALWKWEDESWSTARLASLSRVSPSYDTLERHPDADTVWAAYCVWQLAGDDAS